MKKKVTLILLGLLFFGALCFGGGVLYGQHVLKSDGFAYEYTETAITVNLNTCTEQELCAIEGIGSRTAEKIISSREELGNFDEPHNLVDRGIIGEKKYKQISGFLTAE